MPRTDSFSVRYRELLDGGYDCVDRIVLNGYVSYLHRGAVFVVGGGRCSAVTTTWINHWAFPIIDPDWGHITIKVCPHPPFHVQVALNGHEYVARQAARQGMGFSKEANVLRIRPTSQAWRRSQRPTYDLTVFKVHCGLLTLKIFTKGERVLRIEAIVHNAEKEFSRGYGIARFAEMANALRSIVIRFLNVLHSVDACWVSDDTWACITHVAKLRMTCANFASKNWSEKFRGRAVTKRPRSACGAWWRWECYVTRSSHRFCRCDLHLRLAGLTMPEVISTSITKSYSLLTLLGIAV